MGASAGDDWQRVEALFYAARELAPSARPAFLDRACGADAALKLEVQSLLDSSDKTLGFLQASVLEAARGLNVSNEDFSAERHVGAYRLLRVLGEGGMGRVYLAARADDLYRQQVAIKLMHPGLGQAQRMIARFAAERQILANLNHPNIARLLDGGVDDGLPYFVMEYVDGAPIDSYCRRQNLRTEDRLRLFTTVCAAVEYAHKNLVVHRDIKPGNILVSHEGMPKLLDFGIAKLLDPEAGEPATRTTERMMTPEYASPEQVRGDRVTTSTDVYALGVLLYELLSGSRPFHFETASPIEMARAICEQEPTAPSITSQAHPESAPPDAAKELGGDLDNIVLMAMRKEPARRYASVSQLAEDIEAYLDGYPVHARTDTWKYRSGKFVRRHKASVTAAIVIAVALVGFSIGMGVLARRAQRERTAAEREAQFLNSIFQSTTPAQTKGKQITGRELLDQGAARAEMEFSGEPQLQATLFDNIGRAYMGLGVYDKAVLLLQRAYDLKRKTQGDTLDTANTEDGLATARRLSSEFKQAEPLFRDALAIRRNKLGPTHPLVAESMSNLGECLYWEEQNREAESLLRNALDIQRSRQPQSDAIGATENYLALVLERKGQFSTASELLRNALAIQARAEGTDSPDYANSLHNLAGTLIDAGDLFGAEAMDRQALALRRKINGEGHPDLVYPLNNLGFVFLERGDWAGATPFLQEGLSIQRKMSTNDPRLAGELNNWARMLQEKGDYKQAQQTYEQSLSMMRATTGPETWSVAKIMANFGLLFLDEGNYVEAEQYERRALEMREKLGGSESPDLAASLVNLAIVRSAQRDPASAEPLLRRALDIRQKELSAGHPGIISVKVRLGEVLIDEGKLAEAEALLREAETEIHAVPFPLVPWQIAEAEIALGDAMAANGHSEQARALLRDPESRLKGYPQATLLRQILQRGQKTRALSKAAN